MVIVDPATGGMWKARKSDINEELKKSNIIATRNGGFLLTELE